MYLRKNVVLAIVGGALLKFLIATNVTWSSSVLPKLTNAATSPFGRAIDKDEASWITSIFGFGSILGSYLFSYLSEKAGKKMALLSAGVPCLVANCILYYTTSVQLYIFARFLLGLSIGTMYLFPIYVAELTHKNMREIIYAIYGCVIGFGFLFSNAIGPFISISTLSLILGTISLIFLVFFSIFGQEVPHYYLKTNQYILAREALEKITGGYEDIDETFDQIKNKFEEEKTGKIKDLFMSKPLIKGFIICTALLLFGLFSGNMIILFYGQMIVQNINPELSAEICVIILSTVTFLTSLLAPPLCSRFPKRTLLIFSGMSMFLSEAVLGIYIYCDRNLSLPKSLTSIPIICLTIFITGHSIGFGPLPFMILGEIFPARVKAVTVSSISLIVGIIAFILTKYFMDIVEAIGIHGFFLCCAFSCLLSTIFTKFYVIETKNKSLEQIQYELSL